MPYEFQSKILRKYSEYDELSLILPPGAGKTRVSLLWSTSKPSGYRLVLCPNQAVPVWQAEIHKWLGKGQIVGAMVDMSRNAKIALAKHFGTTNNGWLIVPYQTFRSIANYYTDIRPPAVCILDESHYIQNPRAQVTRAVHTHLSFARCKAILSGTPFGNTYLDVWAQWYFLDRGKRLGRSFYQFRYNHFKPDEMGWKWELRRSSYAFINRAMRDTGPIMEEKDMDLPPRTYNTIYVDPTPWQRKCIKTLKEEFSVYFADGRPITTTKWVITQVMRMRQVCSGFITVDRKAIMVDGKKKWVGKKHIVRGTSAKYDTMLELIENDFKDHKVVIWCSFRHEVKRVAEILNKKAISHVVYKGGMSNEERDQVVKAFQDPGGSVRCFVGSISAGGQAITLTASDRVIYISNPYQLRHRDQSEKRTHRIGSEHHTRVHYTDVITRGEIDSHIHELLTVKRWKNELLLLNHLIKNIFGTNGKKS